VQQAKSACKRKGLFQDYDNAIEVESEAVDNAKNFQEAITNTTGTVPNQPSLDELKANLKEALLVQKEAQEAQATAVEVSSCFMQTHSSSQLPNHWPIQLSQLKPPLPMRGTLGLKYC
jgi:hypothetical protein